MTLRGDTTRQILDDLEASGMLHTDRLAALVAAIATEIATIYVEGGRAAADNAQAAAINSIIATVMAMKACDNEQRVQ